MESLTNLKGPLFDKAEALMESRGPVEEYFAGAVHASEGYYYAAFAGPGQVPGFAIADDGGPAIFESIKAAETRARELLFKQLNADLEAEKEQRG